MEINYKLYFALSKERELKMAKKVKKVKKQMSPQTKRNIGNVFKSIISNQAAIDGAKEAPFYIAIIFFVLSLILPLIPILVSSSKLYGASFVDSYNYNADIGLAYTTKDLKSKNFTFKIEGGELTYYQNGSKYETINNELVSYHTLKNEKGKEYYNFMFYITDKKGSDLVDFVSELSAKQYEVGTLTPKTTDAIDIERYERDEVKFYSANFIILGRETMGVQLFKYQTTTTASTTYGGLDWNLSNTPDLLERLLDVNDKVSETVNENQAIFENWKSVFNETYENQKVKTMWTTVGIYAAVYAGLMIFMGLMIFLMTRGKSNPNRVINFWVALKISWWASFTPALLGMIVGFLFAGGSIGQMGFIVLLSLRIMWLSMRQLRPM